MLTRSGRKILDRNITSLIRLDSATPNFLEELIIDLHECPPIVPQLIVNHRYYDEIVHGVLKIIVAETQRSARVAGHALYLLGALLDAEVGREKTVPILTNPDKNEDTQHLLACIAALIETNEIEIQTNASGTVALLFDSEECVKWACEQESCEMLISLLAATLVQSDMWVASNCALALARFCKLEEGTAMITAHEDFEGILIQMITAVGVDNEGRGMNAVFALVCIMESEEGRNKIIDMKESLDLTLGLINMLRCVDDQCRKNAAYCLQKISETVEGQDRINGDPDIDLLLKLLCNLLTCGDESLGKMAAVTLKNLNTKLDGYILQKDYAPTRRTLEHVLRQMHISKNYRKDAIEALKTLMLAKPDPPKLNVESAYAITANWEKVDSKLGVAISYQLFCDDRCVYAGSELTFTTGGLQEGTEYAFKVRAYNQEGEESFISQKSIAQTERAISSPPNNLRAIHVTASEIKVVWERPSQIRGHPRGYYVEDEANGIHYETSYMHHDARNLQSDTEYSFKICAITNHGKGDFAILEVKTLKEDYHAPSKPKIIPVGYKEICIAWKPPFAPPGRINGFEVLCNSKSVYFGMNTRCFAQMLTPNIKYKFVVVAWTTRGRVEGQPIYQQYNQKMQNYRWSNRREVIDFLDANEENFDAIESIQDEEESEKQNEEESDQSRTPRPRSRKNTMEREMQEGLQNEDFDDELAAVHRNEEPAEE